MKTDELKCYLVEDARSYIRKTGRDEKKLIDEETFGYLIFLYEDERINYDQLVILKRFYIERKLLERNRIRNNVNTNERRTN